MAQNCFAHGPGATTTCSPTSTRPAEVSTAVIDPSDASSNPRTSTPGSTDTPSSRHFPCRPVDRVHVEGEAALVLVQADRDALRAPVGEEPLHVRVDFILADDQLRAVPDPFLASERLPEVCLLHRRPERDVADRVVCVGRRVGLPHLDAGLHQLAHRRLEVVVADDAAGDPGRARTGMRLVQHEDVRASAVPASAELLREVVRGREPVDSGPDDDVWNASRQHYCSVGNDVAECDMLAAPGRAGALGPRAVTRSISRRAPALAPPAHAAAPWERRPPRWARGRTRDPSRPCRRP